MNQTPTILSIEYTDGAPLAPDDPRASMSRAIQVARAVLRELNLDNAGCATQCPDWNALDIARHIVAIIDRATAGPGGADLMSMPILADLRLDELATAFDDSVNRLHEAWLDDTVLDQMIEVPWGTFPGAAVIGAYASELIIHTWDLATAIGAVPNWPDHDVVVMTQMLQEGIPESPRGDEMPFGPVVRPSADSAPIAHLVGWLGRRA